MSAGRPGRQDAAQGRAAGPLRQRLDGGGNLVHLDDEVAEPGAGLHRSVGRPAIVWSNAHTAAVRPADLGLMRALSLRSRTGR